MKPSNVVEEIYSRNSNRKPVPLSRTREPLSLSGALKSVKKSGATGIIAEFKRSSPSGFTNLNSPDIMKYFHEIAGNRRIAGFSVLTEPDYFRGAYEDITRAQKFEIPILDKDFISSRLMVENAFNSGADAILLILDFLPENDVYLLSDYAAEFGMESLIEFHEPALVEKIQQGQMRLFGYNRRNLSTLKMEPREDEIREAFSKREIGMILESGITSEYARNHDLSGYAGMLIGASILEGDMLRESL